MGSAYWLIMLFVLVAFFQAFNLTNVTEPLNALLKPLTPLYVKTLLQAAWMIS